MAPFTYSFTILSTNFDIEPLLESYTKTYPDGEMKNYNIVFKTEYDREHIPFSYIIVTEYNVPAKQARFLDYLQAWCKVNRGKWALGSISSVFPEPKHPHGSVAGELPSKS